MSKTADIVVIGGGVTGLSIALHLKKLGAGRVVLTERHHIGAGQSGHAAGIIRALVAHRSVAHILMESLRFFATFEDEFGEKLPANRAGFLLLNKSRQSDFLDHVLGESKAGGCAAARISAVEAVELQPGIRQGQDDIYAFEPGAIHVDPMLVTQILARAARRAGVEIITGCEVHAMLTDGAKIQGVLTSLDDIATDTIVVGTAAWGAPQLARIGIEVPVYPHRTEMAFFSVWPGSDLRVVRILSDAAATLYLRPEGTDQMFVGWREGDRISSTQDLVPADPDNYWQSANHTTLEDMKRRLTMTLPFMAEGFVHRSYACVYDYTPDGMPILDSAESVRGLYFSLGYSGGGFSLSPWVGSVMARYIVDGVKSHEMQLVRLSRFRDGQLLRWGNVEREVH